VEYAKSRHLSPALVARHETQMIRRPLSERSCKLDRLARNVAFISNLMESGLEFVAVDML
jgi:hypothetical protein